MVIDMAHARWRKKLLESRKDGVLYQMIGLDESNSVNDILFMYRNGNWQFKVDMNKPSVDFTDVDEAARYIIGLGVERYDAEFGI